MLRGKMIRNRGQAKLGGVGEVEGREIRGGLGTISVAEVKWEESRCRVWFPEIGLSGVLWWGGELGAMGWGSQENMLVEVGGLLWWCGQLWSMCWGSWKDMCVGLEVDNCRGGVGKEIKEVILVGATIEEGLC